MLESYYVTLKDNNGWTSLMYAARYNRNADVIKTILSASPDINTRDKDGWTALMIAAKYNPDVEVTKALIQAGADTSLKNVEGQTALTYAAVYNGSLDVLDELISAGPSPKAKNEALLNAAHLCDDVDVIETLVNAGADVNAVSTDHDTVLSLAAEYNENPDVIYFLIESGAKPETLVPESAEYPVNYRMALDYLRDNTKIEKNRVYWRLIDELYSLRESLT